MKNFTFLLLASAMTVGFYSCDDDAGSINNSSEFSLSVSLEHFWGNDVFSLNKANYLTPSNDTFEATLLRYHINHFQLQKIDGSWIDAPNVWHIVDLGITEELELGNLPSGEFQKIRFTIGVEDSLTNYNNVLASKFIDPMYWMMNSGYINFKFEGKSNSIPNNAFAVHVGGYKYNEKTAKTFEFDLPEILKTLGNENINVEFKVDMLEYFQNPNLIDIKEINVLHNPGEQAQKISNNWATMFKIGAMTSN